VRTQELCAVGIFLLTSLSLRLPGVCGAAKTLMQLSAVAVCIGALCNCGNEHVCICAAIIDLSLQHDALFVNIVHHAMVLMGFVFFVDMDAKAHLAVFLFASGGRRDCKCGRVNINLSSSFECTDCFQCGNGIWCGLVYCFQYFLLRHGIKKL
jgi:hypothetical protein